MKPSSAYLHAEVDREVQRQRAGLLQGGHAFPRRLVPARGDEGAPEALEMMVSDSDVLIDFLEGRAPEANRVALALD